MPENVNVHASGSWVGDTLEEFKKLPTWGKVVAGLVVLAVVTYAIHVYSSRNTANNATSSSPSTGTRTNGGMLSASNYPQDSSAPIPYQPTYINPPVGATTPPTSYQPRPIVMPMQGIFATIRQAFGLGPTAGYDTANPGGIPIRETPGGNIIGMESFGSQTEITGTPVSGPNNFGPGSSNGSDIWYKLPGGGYISGYDVTGLQSSPKVQSSAPTTAATSGTGTSGGRFHIVQYGENMNSIARAYGLKSWRDFGVSEFWHGQKVGIPA